MAKAEALRAKAESRTRVPRGRTAAGRTLKRKLSAPDRILSQHASSRAHLAGSLPEESPPVPSPFRGEVETDVVVVGGGLTGCACAWSFASAGVKVVLLEADRIAGGATAASTGLIREDFDASFQETSAAHGLRAARTLWQGLSAGVVGFCRRDQTAEHQVRLGSAGLAAGGSPRYGRRPPPAARVRRASGGGLRSHVDDGSGSGEGGGRRWRRGHPDARLCLRSVSGVPGARGLGD